MQHSRVLSGRFMTGSADQCRLLFHAKCLRTLHIQLNLSNMKVMILNRRYNQAPSLTAQIQVFDFDSKSVFKEEAFFSLGPSEVKETTSLSGDY